MIFGASGIKLGRDKKGPDVHLAWPTSHERPGSWPPTAVANS